MRTASGALRGLMLVVLSGAVITQGGAVLPGFDATSIPGNDDGGYGSAVPIGFNINFYGDTYSSLWVNNNGNVTFAAGMYDYTPFGLTGALGQAIIAPFFADVDTRTGNLVAFGTGTADGRSAFGVSSIDVGYYRERLDKLNSFQMLLIDRSDVNPGDFDIEFNYDKVLWETGEASGGSGGLGGSSAHVGFSKGTGEAGTFYEFLGSGENGYFLDGSSTGLIHRSLGSDVLGRYIFEVRNGNPIVNVPVPGAVLLASIGTVFVGWLRRKRSH